MKVRRKSEIAEAVQWDGTAQTILGVTLQDYREGMWVLKNDWLVKIDGLPTAIYRPDAFAAHYEPVHGLTQSDDTLTKAVSEEQPWPKENQVMQTGFGRIELDKGMSPTEVKLRTSKQEVTITNLAPHRATIALIPCSDCVSMGVLSWRVLKDGDPVEIKRNYYCGTEAEAKAKMESLSK